MPPSPVPFNPVTRLSPVRIVVCAPAMRVISATRTAIAARSLPSRQIVTTIRIHFTHAAPVAHKQRRTEDLCVQNSGLITSNNLPSTPRLVAARTSPLWFFCNSRSNICELRIVLAAVMSSARQVPVKMNCCSSSSVLMRHCALNDHRAIPGFTSTTSAVMRAVKLSERSTSPSP